MQCDGCCMDWGWVILDSCIERVCQAREFLHGLTVRMAYGVCVCVRVCVRVCVCVHA